ncbi:MAG: hypothetical protein ACREHG_10570 [Candidatus Saccharimonadales bacterium]
MSKFFAAVVGIYGVVVKYPAAVAALANIAVVCAATFGFSLTPDQVVTAVTFCAAITGVLVHVGVIPMRKAKQGNVPLEVRQAVIQKTTKEGL